ncbi:hypothetical protein [Ensifer sesbaniae]|uniref:hypothetical protein n=1 Tax=Ensifer sesbaniae TaxID=1214071 RepID=UPI00156A18FE|nr:hypothetical protein [Ensifer sesbaniae]NRQ17466.1 hypothetical protein [Ensifer sesbaniae]
MPLRDKPTNTGKQQRKSDHGRGEADSNTSPQKGGQIGVDASVRSSKADRTASPKKAAETRKPIKERTLR